MRTFLGGVHLLLIPNLYTINHHSPFYYSNTTLFNSYHRIVSVQMNHQLMHTKEIATWCLPPINYQYGHLKHLFLEPEKNFYQVDNLNGFLEHEEHIAFLPPLQTMAKDLVETPNFSEGSKKAVALYQRYLNNVNLELKVPILTISEAMLPFNEHWKFYKEKFISWLKKVVEFFKELTNAKCLVEQITLISFTYDKNGNIRYFHEFHKVKFARNLEMTAIQSHNLRELAKALNTGEMVVQYEQYLQNKQLSFDTKFFADNVVFNNLSKLQSEYSKKFMDFDDYDQLLEHNLKRSKHSIGVFVDLAYMYIGLESYFIDFDILLAELLGHEKKGQIADLISVQFKPNYENKVREQRVYSWLVHIKEQLEYYGFSVQEVSNDTAKAKQIIDGEEYDVDDQYLMSMLRKNRTKYSEVILLTGDQHFMVEVQALQQHGVIVHLVSCNPRDTNSELIAQADYHYFIKQFINSLYIKKGI